MNYVFPASDRASLSTAVALQFTKYLEEGDTVAGLVGLMVEPLFLVRAGTGAPGDESAYSPAQIVFPDDEAPGVPYIRFISVAPMASPSDWGDDQEVSLWKVVLDCRANEYQGAVTEGADPGGAENVLSDRVWHLLSHFEAMACAGFVNADAVPGAMDVVSIEFEIPITISFEIYVSKE